eukprot:5671704-Pleurochrysis_carterae.AAC.1
MPLALRARAARTVRPMPVPFGSQQMVLAPVLQPWTRWSSERSDGEGSSDIFKVFFRRAQEARAP